MIVSVGDDGRYHGDIRDERYGVLYRDVATGATPSETARTLIAETARRA